MDGTASFGYDAFELRTSATGADGATQTFTLNYALGLPSIATVRSGGSDQRYYVHLPNGALLYAIEAADNTHRYYHFDEIGSTNSPRWAAKSSRVRNEPRGRSVATMSAAGAPS